MPVLRERAARPRRSCSVVKRKRIVERRRASFRIIERDPQPQVRTKRFPIHCFPSPQSLLFPFLFAIHDKFTRSLRSNLRTSLTITERYTQPTLFLFLSLCERNNTSRNSRTSERADTVPAKSLKTIHDSDLVRTMMSNLVRIRYLLFYYFHLHRIINHGQYLRC